MELLKQLSRQAEQVEVTSLSDEKTTIEFSANQLKSSSVTETRGMAVRVVRKGRLGFAASTDLQSLDKLSASVLESAAYGDPVTLEFPAPQTAAQVQTYDPKIAELPIPDLVEIGRQILALVLPVEPDARCNVTIERSVQTVSIQNHAGLDAHFQRSPLSIGFEIDRIAGDDVLILYDQLGTLLWDDGYLDFARQLVEKLIQARTLTTIKSGAMPVVFSPIGSLALMLPLNEGLNGKNAYKGTSPLVGKIGEKLFDEKISVIDDGTIDGKFASGPYDDEGVPHRRNILVENGVFKGFYYDLKTAAQFGVQTTGNGSRSLFSPPNPSLTNFLVQPGHTPLADMIAGIDEGILVEDLLGIGQGNIISGAFSNPLSLAHKIHKGEIVGRVKNLSIADNIYDLLTDVAAVSRETQWVYSTFNAPYILLPNMNVVAKEE